MRSGNSDGSSESGKTPRCSKTWRKIYVLFNIKVTRVERILLSMSSPFQRLDKVHFPHTGPTGKTHNHTKILLYGSSYSEFQLRFVLSALLGNFQISRITPYNRTKTLDHRPIHRYMVLVMVRVISWHDRASTHNKRTNLSSSLTKEQLQKQRNKETKNKIKNIECKSLILVQYNKQHTNVCYIIDFF